MLEYCFGFKNILGNPLDIFQTPATRLSDTFWTPEERQTQGRVIRLVGGWVDGVLYIIQPLWGSILQAETCQNFSLAEIQDGAESGNKVGLVSVRAAV